MLPSDPGKCSCRCFALSASEKDLWGFHVSEPRSYISEPRSHVSEPQLPGSTLLGLTLSALYTSSTLIPLHQILVCKTFVQSHQFWDAFRSELVGGPTKTMLVAWSWTAGLWEEDNQDQIIRTKHPRLEGWEDSDRVLHHQNLPYAPEIIKAELISRYPNDTWAGGSELKRPIDWPIILPIRVTFESLRYRVKAYVKRIVTLASRQKSAHKLYGYTELSLAPTCW